MSGQGLNMAVALRQGLNWVVVKGTGPKVWRGVETRHGLGRGVETRLGLACGVGARLGLGRVVGILKA